MHSKFNEYPYILFYINREGKYEMMPFSSAAEIPRHFLKETSYIYSRRGRGSINTEPYWFNYKPYSPDQYNSRFVFTDIEVVPSEVLALKLLIEDK